MKSSWLRISALLVVLAGGAWFVTRGNGGGRCCVVPTVGGDASFVAPDSARPATPSGLPRPLPSSAPDSLGPTTARSGLPRLVDLGSKTCIPCKMMAPILEELHKDYANRFATEFIDVRENPQAARQYGIRLIPTQIFLDATGREVFRHQGFFAKDAILAKWKELGVAVP